MLCPTADVCLKQGFAEFLQSFNSTVSEWAISDGFDLLFTDTCPDFLKSRGGFGNTLGSQLWRPHHARQDSEALQEGLTRPLAMTAINCPVFSGRQKSSDNCIVGICFCVQSDAAFLPDTLNTSPQGCPGWCSALMPFQGSTLPG